MKIKFTIALLTALFATAPAAHACDLGWFTTPYQSCYGE